MEEAYKKNGVLVLEDFFSVGECKNLMDRMESIIEETDPASIDSIFSTIDRNQVSDQYLLQSADKISLFLEEEAVDEKGNLVVPLNKAVNKVGHALHDKDQVFSTFSRQGKLESLLSGLGMRAPVLMQSMYICKQPNIGGEVTCHQDAPFLWTTPQSVIGIWVALEDATLENGCLWGIPAVHTETLPRSRYWVKAGQTHFDVLDDRDWPEDKKVPLAVKAGSVVVLHGQFPHLSGANRSNRSRHAYAIHYVDACTEYAQENWLQRSAQDPATGFSLAKEL
ncbi:phytanoyl-CoA dioxygenase family protein [Temperatibacter marinus]|uniref:Phytanoyl-CoA dioxygenase family protein n=1 Tax=Temperatibacter marinus TaxID=1456591 RepID=A0AA52EG42_9PROT|nr:phytanoyl-CoA dioxygenase family protein [Temperatibacter marinus]